jgi:hypothetical protein
MSKRVRRSWIGRSCAGTANAAMPRCFDAALSVWLRSMPGSPHLQRRLPGEFA